MPDDLIGWLSANVLPFEPEVRRWLRNFKPAIVDEDDVIQEAYCKIANLGDLARIQSGRAYFFTIVRNIVLEQIRRQQLVRIDAMAEIEALSIIDEGPSAERIFEGRRKLALVSHLINGLPERCRAILILRRVEGLSQRETAARLGVSENVVEKQIALGVKTLLGQLKEMVEDGSFTVRQVKRDRRTGRAKDRRRN